MKETGEDKLNIRNIRCPECQEVTPAKEWGEQNQACEDCGSHDGLACPKCGMGFDHVWGFKRLKENSKDIN